jgi:hypothetical protein
VRSDGDVHLRSSPAALLRFGLTPATREVVKAASQ